MDNIDIRDEIVYDNKFFHVLLMTAYDLDYKRVAYKHQLILAEAILNHESFLAGYSKPLIKPITFHRMYFTKYEDAKRLNPCTASVVLDSKKGKNRRRYVEMLSEQYPSFLHECYRQATRIHGLTENTATICTSMENYAKATYPDDDIRGQLKMTHYHFWKFFYMHGGKLKKPVTKPRLTKEHVDNRLKFANKWIKKYSQEEGVYVAFLDEKWFYTCSRRKKMKILPRASFETEEESFIAKPKLRSRRFPCKVMFLGVICPPVDGKTNGRILLKRVSQKVKSKRQSYNQNFVCHFVINHRLKGGEWKSLFPKNGNISVDSFISLIQDNYDIDDDIATDLCFVYKSFSITKKTGEAKPKLVKLSCSDAGPVLKGRKIKCKKEDGSVYERDLKLNDIELRVNPQKGRFVEKDITCDSNFMMDHIREIGKSIRDAYSFLPSTQIIHLFMDNAGGHGKTVIKQQYEKLLKEEFCISIEWQVPNSPETNMLDLGVWVALQSLVEKLHKGKVMNSHELSKSVMSSFAEISDHILTRVYDRWRLVMHLIISGKGTNEVVESHRGLKKPLIIAELPTVPDAEAKKGYTYDYDSCDYNSDDSDVDDIDLGESATTLEMAFDCT